MLTARRLGKVFGPQDAPLEILRDVSFEVPAGQSLAITGPSGSGKSTLLDILGSLDTPSSGGVEIDSIDLPTHVAVVFPKRKFRSYLS